MVTSTISFKGKSHGYIHHEFYRVDYTILIHSEKVMRFFSTIPVQELKLSITGDTAKILGLTLERLCTFTLRPILPKRRMRQDLSEEEVQPYKLDPFPFGHICLSSNKLNPHNLINPSRAHNTIRLHWKLSKTWTTW